MKSQLDEIKGSQLPTMEKSPPAVSSAGVEAVELARSAGLLLDPWQEHVLDQALGERADGTWAALEVGLIVPRQNGKGAILEARELAGLFLFGEQLILHSAHEFKTAQEGFRRLLALVQNTPDLDRMVARVRTAHGEEGIELKSGARIRFVARSSGSARGFSGDCVLMDEVYLLPSTAIAALFPTLSARPNPQVWYTTSSPPVLDEGSEQVRRLRLRALSDNPGRLSWMEWSNESTVDPADGEAWARANPALGIRIKPEFVESERQSLPERVFAVERLGVWLTGVQQSKIATDEWARCGFDNAACLPDDLVFAMDLPPDRGSVIIAVSDGETVEIAEQTKLANAVEWMVERWERWEPRAVVIDGAGPCASLIPDLQAAGVRVVLTGSRDFSNACVRFYDAVQAEKVSHRKQAVLDAAVGAARTRKLGDSWAWARSSTAHDISPLVAVSLALWGAQVIEAAAEDEDKPKSLVVY
jgi:phage terminase large subunit-like protein